jgi:hypothetical protein
MYEARQEYLLDKAMTLGSVKREGKEEGLKESITDSGPHNA